MRLLSIDLRERIVGAYRNQEGSYAVLAARFAVSRAVMGELVRQQRDQGTLQTHVHRRGRKPAVRGVQEENAELSDAGIKTSPFDCGDT